MDCNNSTEMLKFLCKSGSSIPLRKRCIHYPSCDANEYVEKIPVPTLKYSGGAMMLWARFSCKTPRNLA